MAGRVARRSAVDAGIARCSRVREAQVLIERWRHHYNTVRPHSALGYRPPAPQAIVPKWTDPACALDGLQPDQPFPFTVPGLT
jgi:hypothetical protein